MNFTKSDATTSDEQVEKLTKELNIHYRFSIGSFIDLLYTRVDFSFALHKLEKFSSNPGKVQFEGLVHLLRYIRYNKNLILNYYAEMKDAPLSDLLIQSSIKTENQLMDLSGSSWKDFQDTFRSTRAYIIFYQGGPIYHGKNVPRPVSQSIAESEYNAEFTAGMSLAYFRMLIHELLNKDPDIVPEEDPIIILDSKSDVCMDNNGKDSKHTRHIFRRVKFVRNCESEKCTRLTGVKEVCN